MGWIVSSPVGQAVRREPVSDVAVTSTGARSVKLRPRAKRAFDATAAFVLLAAVAPLMLLIAVVIKLDTPGPIFFRVRRVGYRGQTLMMLKFRKMYQEATGIPLTASDDPRLTRVGRILARTRLDELPQLWDVLRGRMSIVGPRPEDPGFVALHSSAYERILTVRPGITGLSQLAFAEECKILDVRDLMADYAERILPQKVELDMMYATSYRLSHDLRVLIWTVVAMLLHRPIAVHRATGRLTVRRRRPPETVTETPGTVTETPAVAEAT